MSERTKDEIDLLREGVVRTYMTYIGHSVAVAEEAAAHLFPYPPTRRPRERTDADGETFRVVDGRIEMRWRGEAEFTVMDGIADENYRIVVDLLANPTELA